MTLEIKNANTKVDKCWQLNEKIFNHLKSPAVVSESSSRKTIKATEIADFIRERCQSNLPERNYTEKLREIRAYEFNLLIMNQLWRSARRFCSDSVQSATAFFLHSYTRGVMECFPKEEKYIPKFINESYTEFMKVFCASNGKSIDDLFSSEADVCSENINKGKVEKDEIGLTLPLNAILTKKQLCSDLQSMKKFYIDNQQEYCSKQTVYVSAMSKIFDAIEKSCVEDTSEEKTKD